MLRISGVNAGSNSFVNGLAMLAENNDRDRNGVENPGSTEHREMEDLWRSIAEGVSAATGEEFFRSLVTHLSKALKADYVFVGELTEHKPARIRSIATFVAGKLGDSFEYGLAETPCENVVGGDLCVFLSGVQQQFPRDYLLVEMGVEGYVGAPLFDTAGCALGLLVALYRGPVSRPELAKSLLRIFAVRGAAELERQQAEKKLRESEERYRMLIAVSTEGIGRFEFDHPIPLDQSVEQIVEQIFESAYLAECNDAMARMYGFTKGAEMVGRRAKELVVSTDHYIEIFREFLASGYRIADAEVRNIDRHGNEKYFLMNMVGVVDRSALQRVWRVIHDITERKRAELDLRETNERLRQVISAENEVEGIVGDGPAIRKVLEGIETVAPTDAAVLILGETGTGKELVARAVHRLSLRKHKPLVTVNCAALASGVIESELFGHERGAFTGAVSRRPGRFELADGGTIFLDEIGDLPAALQSKLLRVLQEGEFERVGGTQTLRVDVRVVAATNRNLEAAVEDGSFRADLYYRLNVFPLKLPLLLDRKEDIPLLVHRFLNDLSKRLGKPLSGVSESSMRQLMEYGWPGNVRELMHVIERAAILARGSVVQVEDLVSRPAPRKETPAGAQTLEDVERTHILTALEQASWVIEGSKGAAQVLGLHPNTLRYRLKKLGIQRPA